MKRKIENITSLNQHKMLFVTDMEAGAGSAIDGATRFPSMRAACEAGDENLAYLMGKAAVYEARKVGFHWTFGPCVDILGNHFSPMTSIRSASENKDDVLTYLIHLGYLGFDQKRSCAFIPNEEIRQDIENACRHKL